MKLLGLVKIGNSFCGFLDMDKCYRVAYDVFTHLNRFICDDGEYGLQCADFLDKSNMEVKQDNILRFQDHAFCKLPRTGCIYVCNEVFPRVMHDGKKYIEVIVLTDTKLKYGLFFRFTEESKDNIEP